VPLSDLASFKSTPLTGNQTLRFEVSEYTDDPMGLPEVVEARVVVELEGCVVRTQLMGDFAGGLD
jgi:hypothetical protein